VALVALGLGLLGLGWMLSNGLRSEPTAKGPPPVPSVSSSEAPSVSTPVPSRLCALLTSVLSVAAAQLMGCATTPPRPDPIGYLARCSPEARATPVKLGLSPDENPSYLRSGTPASEQSIEDGGSLNLKPGPVTAVILVELKGREVEMKVTGEAVTLPHRVYMQFDWLHLPDGSSLPICGVAVDGLHQYGIATYGKFPIPGSKVDPARVDQSPGSVVLNDPRFETVLVGPEDYPVPRIDLAPPDWR
jgi:serine/threonine-protein kinase